jgi:hypothetical protein
MPTEQALSNLVCIKAVSRQYLEDCKERPEKPLECGRSYVYPDQRAQKLEHNGKLAEIEGEDESISRVRSVCR